MSELPTDDRSRHTVRICGKYLQKRRLLHTAQPYPDTRHTRGGQLCFADTRMPVCCQDEPDRMTTPLVPDMQPGTLVMFPGERMHHVTPYTGKSPRIILAWNIDSRPIPGNAIPGGLPEH